ncbi:MAG: MFS transporter [Pseudomonadota bacterium]
MAGRFYRDNAPWLAAAGLMTFGSSFGQTFFISLSAGGIRAEHGLSDGDWGAIYTIATLASAAVLVQAGRLADHLALRPLVIGVTLIYCLACAAVGLGQSVWVLGLGIFGLRLAGQGLISHLGQTATARWFNANRGRAMAFVVLGYPLGEALLPPLAVAAMQSVGWRGVWGIAAAVLALAILPAILALLARGRRRPSGAPPGEGGARAATGMDGRHWSRAEVLRHWSFWALMPAVLAPSFIGTVLFFHQVHLSEVRGWDLATMAAGYPVYAGLSVALSLATGRVIDRVGPVRLLPFFLVPMALAVSVLMLPGGAWVWLAVLLGIGMSQGVVVTLFGTLWPTLYGTRHIGGIKALTVSAMVVSTAVGPGITGLAIDAGLPLPAQAPAMALWCVLATCLMAVVAARLSARLGDRAADAPATAEEG